MALSLLVLSILVGHGYFHYITTKQSQQINDQSAEIHQSQEVSKLLSDRITDLTDELEDAKEDVADNIRIIDALQDENTHLENLLHHHRRDWKRGLNELDDEIDEAKELAAKIKTKDDLFEEMYEEAKESVVLVVIKHFIENPDGTLYDEEPMVAMGTGFSIYDGTYILTAKHVLKPWLFDMNMALWLKQNDLRISKSELAIFEYGSVAIDDEDDFLFENAITEESGKLSVVYYAHDTMHTITTHGPFGMIAMDVEVHVGDHYNDAAVLRLHGHKIKPLEIADPDSEVDEFEGIMTLGFPLFSNLSHKIISPIPATGIVRAKGKRSLLVSSITYSGNSGGPVLNEDGKVVGMMTLIYNREAVLGKAIDHNSLAAHLGGALLNSKVQDQLKAIEELDIEESGDDSDK